MLRGNRFREIPSALRSLRCIKWLNLSDNEVQDIGEALAQMKTLKFLNLNSNSVKEIPLSLFSLTNLSELHLCGSLSLRSLGVHADIADNVLNSIPSEIGLLSSLHTLDLSENMITEFPSIFKLTNLTTLNLNCIPITACATDTVKRT